MQKETKLQQAWTLCKTPSTFRGKMSHYHSRSSAVQKQQVTTNLVKHRQSNKYHEIGCLIGISLETGNCWQRWGKTSMLFIQEVQGDSLIKTPPVTQACWEGWYSLHATQTLVSQYKLSEFLTDRGQKTPGDDSVPLMNVQRPEDWDLDLVVLWLIRKEITTTLYW